MRPYVRVRVCVCAQRVKCRVVFEVVAFEGNININRDGRSIAIRSDIEVLYSSDIGQTAPIHVTHP